MIKIRVMKTDWIRLYFVIKIDKDHHALLRFAFIPITQPHHSKTTKRLIQFFPSCCPNQDCRPRCQEPLGRQLIHRKSAKICFNLEYFHRFASFYLWTTIKVGERMGQHKF